MRLFAFATWALLLVAAPMTGLTQEQPCIHLQEIAGRTWLIDPAGRPFFAHGVTHIGTARHGEDVRALGRACKELGFNAYGYGCPDELKGDLPYLEGRNHLVPMSLYRASDGSFRYVDVFDPCEQARLELKIKTMCLANRTNRNLIGYCWTDLGAWPLENATGRNWVAFIRDLPADAPGRRAYREFLQAWPGGDSEARALAFLRIIAREYFRVLGKANRKYDPDHLIFGDRFAFQTVVDEVVEEMLPYVDALAIQPRFNAGFPREDFDRIHRLSGKPILICDFAIRFREAGKNIRGWKPEESPALAGQRYADYLRAALATPYILGSFWCNPIDSKPGFKKSGIKQGLFDQGLRPRPELNRAIRELNRFLNQAVPKR